jgi:hypothetical protein
MRRSQMTSFSQGRGEIRPLDNMEIMRISPSVFAEDKHDSRSDRYAYIPSSEILVALRKEGFEPYAAQQSKSKIEGKSEFTKHMLRFRHLSQFNAAAVGAEVNEVIMVNSHDGTSKINLFGGMYRFVCANGLMVGDAIQEVSFPHTNVSLDSVIEGSYKVLSDFQAVEAFKEEAKHIQLSQLEQKALGLQALSLKFDMNDFRPSLDAILMPRRNEDSDGSLWSTFNILQENIVRGGVPKTVNYPVTGRMGTTRETKNITDSVRLNKGIWNLADAMYMAKEGLI